MQKTMQSKCAVFRTEKTLKEGVNEIRKPFEGLDDISVKDKSLLFNTDLVEALEFNLTWFAILVAVNLQTAWLSPPVALSAYFLKGVVPSWDLKDIYLGMMQFMVIQVIGLVIIILYPKIVLWLPTLLYGQ